MTNIVLSFDTEDFSSFHAADAIRDEARLLARHGIKGNFCLVGLLAKQLVEWGRGDVLDALKYHEIQTHSYGHSLHPTINEYTDLEAFDAAYCELIRQESEALKLIREATGVEHVYAAVPPGNCKSYVAMYGYADMGIPIYADTFADSLDGSGMFFCNALHLDYVVALESLLYGEGYDVDQLLDDLATRKTAVLYNHPNCVLYSDFWDKVNYDKENKHPFGQWEEAPRRSEAEVKSFYDQLGYLLSRLQSDERFCFKTYSQIAKERTGEDRIVTKEQLPQIRDGLRQNFTCLDTPVSLSISDVFLAVVGFLCGEALYRAGKTYGFLQASQGIEAPCTISADEMRLAAQEMDVTRFLPAQIVVGKHLLGPADFLFAALDVLCGSDWVTLSPRSQQPCLDDYPKLRDSDMRGWIHDEKFKDQYLSDRLRWQAWTFRR